MSHRVQNEVPVGSCPTTGKRAYCNKKQAKAARRRTPNGHRLNIYRCEHCGFLHLGHMPTVVRSGVLDKAAWKAGG